MNDKWLSNLQTLVDWVLKSPNRRVEAPHVIWILENGKEIPEGYLVHHIDEDHSNNDASNLELLTRTQHWERHQKSLYEIRRDSAIETHTGMKRTAETRARMSEAARRRFDDPEQRRAVGQRHVLLNGGESDGHQRAGETNDGGTG